MCNNDKDIQKIEAIAKMDRQRKRRFEIYSGLAFAPALFFIILFFVSLKTGWAKDFLETVDLTIVGLIFSASASIITFVKIIYNRPQFKDYRMGTASWAKHNIEAFAFTLAVAAFVLFIFSQVSRSNAELDATVRFNSSIDDVDYRLFLLTNRFCEMAKATYPERSAEMCRPLFPNYP